MPSIATPPAAATGGVRAVLRLEGLCLLLCAVSAYAQWGMGWGWFGALFLGPDVALLAYVAGPRIGAACYNASHSLVGALSCLAAGDTHAAAVGHSTGADLVRTHRL